jgi:hypothetical protein
VFVGPASYEHCERTKYDHAHAAWETARQRWQFASQLRPCLRDAEDRERQLPQIADPGPSRNIPDLERLTHRCTDELPLPGSAWRHAEDEVEAAVKDLETYYRGGDWRDDGYRAGPAKWAALATARQHRRDAVAAARAELEPVARQTELEAAKRLAGTPEGHHLELRMKLDDALDALYDAARSGKDVAAQRAALVAGAKAIVDAIADAPIDIKREVRSDSVIMGLAEARTDTWDPWQQVIALRNVPWAQVPENTVIGPEPEEPRGCGED